MAIVGTIEIPSKGRMISVTGPIVFQESLDLKELFSEMMDNGYSPNAFKTSLIESIEAEIKSIDENGWLAGDVADERKQWRDILLALKSDEAAE